MNKAISKMLQGFDFKFRDSVFIIYKYVNKKLYFTSIYIYGDTEAEINKTLENTIESSIENLRTQIHLGIEMEKYIKLCDKTYSGTYE